MKKNILSPFEYAMMESMVLRQLDFPIFNLLKDDLPATYMITRYDINLLIMFSKVEGLVTKKGIMERILKWYNSMDIVEKKVLYNIHCDPFELFIDAGRIDKEHNILIKK